MLFIPFTKSFKKGYLSEFFWTGVTLMQVKSFVQYFSDNIITICILCYTMSCK